MGGALKILVKKKIYIYSIFCLSQNNVNFISQDAFSFIHQPSVHSQANIAAAVNPTVTLAHWTLLYLSIYCHPMQQLMC